MGAVSRKAGRGTYRRVDGPAVTLRNAVLANDMVNRGGRSEIPESYLTSR
jgi:hypothetical protein